MKPFNLTQIARNKCMYNERYSCRHDKNSSWIV